MKYEQAIETVNEYNVTFTKGVTEAQKNSVINELRRVWLATGNNRVALAAAERKKREMGIVLRLVDID